MADKINKNRHRLSRVFKRALALFIIVIINFNSFSAVVSSNDGSAFITKAEFDALVNDFNSRIEDYEKSIDAKIDGAIAEYLAGLATASSYIMEDLIHVAKTNNVNNLKFIQWKTPQASKDVDDVDGAVFLTKLQGAAVLRTGIRGYITITNHQVNGGAVAYVRYPDNTVSDANTSYYYHAAFPYGTYEESDFKVTGNTNDWSLEDISRYNLHYYLSAQNVSYADATGRYYDSEDQSYYTSPTTVTAIFNTGETAYMPGRRTQNLIPSWLGSNWNSNNYIAHVWTKQDDINYNSFLNYNFANTISGNTDVIARDYKDNYSSTQTKNLNITKPIDTNRNYCPGVAFRVYNVTGNATDGYKETVVLGKYDVNNTQFYFQYNGVKVYNVNWANLVNSFYTTYFNIPYYKYYGIPICKPNKMTGDVTFKLKFTNTKVGDIYPAFTYQINDVKFTNGNLPSSGSLYSETVAQGNSTYTKEITITKDTVKDTTNGDYLYIKIQPSVANQIVSVDTEGDILITIEA